jgi:hypothetical protein
MIRTSPAVLALLVGSSLLAQTPRPGINYDEAKVPPYALPDPLVCEDGSRVTDVPTWLSKRRPELMKLFEEQVYGRTPAAAHMAKVRFEKTEENRSVLGGKATRKQVTVHISDDPKAPKMYLLIMLPNKYPAMAGAKGAPVFVTLNFKGNQATTDDPAIMMNPNWFRDDKEHPGAVVDHHSTEKSRGIQSSRWTYDQIIERGYGVVTCYYGDIFPDHADGVGDSVIPLFYKPGQTQQTAEDWNAIGAWAWGMSRMMDYCLSDPDIDGKHVIATGHSRLGKTTLWAGAQDERFSIVISNCSGAGGAALGKRIFGETNAVLNKSFPHWFCGNFKKYSDNEAAMPVDQHELIALMAPRACLVNSAEEDHWADPHGEFLSVWHAKGVFELFGFDGPPQNQMPPVNQPYLTRAGYNIRPGKHDVLGIDWQVYMDFADKHWKR